MTTTATVVAIESHGNPELGTVRQGDVLRTDDPRVKRNPQFFHPVTATTEELHQARQAYLAADPRPADGQESEAVRPRPRPIPIGRQVRSLKLLVVNGYGVAQAGQIHDTAAERTRELMRLFPDGFERVAPDSAP